MRAPIVLWLILRAAFGYVVPFAGGGLRWHRHSLLRSADTVIEFMGADDGPKELSADEKEEVLYCIGLNAALQIARQTGDLPKLVTKQEMAPVIRAIADTLLDQVEGVAADRIQAVGEELPIFLQGRPGCMQHLRQGSVREHRQRYLQADLYPPQGNEKDRCSHDLRKEHHDEGRYQRHDDRAQGRG